jgi:hypothetical protein
LGCTYINYDLYLKAEQYFASDILKKFMRLHLDKTAGRNVGDATGRLPECKRVIKSAGIFLKEPKI